MEALGNGQAYGLCLPQTSQPGIHYLAGYQVTDLTRAEELGLTIYQVPEAHYLTVPVKGPLPQSIQESWAKIWQEILPNSDDKLADSPLLEVYSDQDPTSPNYQMAIWLPIDQNN